MIILWSSFGEPYTTSVVTCFECSFRFACDMFHLYIHLFISNVGVTIFQFP
jgi:hypothetical protein